MNKSETQNDRGLRLAVQRKNEAAMQNTLPDDFTDRLMQRISQHVSQPQRRRRVWLYSAMGAVAASVILLISLGVVLNARSGGDGSPLVAQTDTLKTSPQRATKQVEEHPVEKKENREVADSVKEQKNRYRMLRPPRHYVAEAAPVESTPEPDPIDADFLMEREMAQEERRVELEMMMPTNGSLQADYMNMTREIRERGERMTQRAEMAMNNEE